MKRVAVILTLLFSTSVLSQDFGLSNMQLEQLKLSWKLKKTLGLSCSDLKESSRRGDVWVVGKYEVRVSTRYWTYRMPMREYILAIYPSNFDIKKDRPPDGWFFRKMGPEILPPKSVRDDVLRRLKRRKNN